MAEVLLFLVKLAVFPVLLVGIVVSAGALFRALRKCGCDCVATPCRARFITAVVAVVGIWLMAPGVPENIHTVSGALALAFYAAVACFGGRWVWRHRDQLTDWAKSHFTE